jgi:hypothetical protein
MTVDDTSELLPAHVRFKRWFLRTLVISLAACALVAVVALLHGTFNRTTARILTTLGALAVHSALAMWCSSSLERRQWPKLSLFGLVAFGISFCVLMLCTWWPDGSEETQVRGILGTGALIGFYVLAIPSADLQERRRWGPVPLLGLIACAVGLVMTAVCIWAEPRVSTAFPKATGVVAVVAFSLAHVCVLLRIPGGATLSWLLGGTIASVWAVAVMWSLAIVLEPSSDFFYRGFGALGVLDASGSLALLIVAKLKQIGKVETLESTPARIEIACPRCTTRQVVDAGKSKCSTCGLKFTIEIEEPRCAKCDYLLWQLPERRCPECGTEF